MLGGSAWAVSTTLIFFGWLEDYPILSWLESQECHVRIVWLMLGRAAAKAPEQNGMDETQIKKKKPATGL